MIIDYFAHPYTCYTENNKHDEIAMTKNYMLCCQRAGKLLHLGRMVFSPISHGHAIHRNSVLRKMEINLEHKLWMEINKEIIKRMNFRGIILAPNWEKSKGCVIEKRIFESADKPVFFYNDLINNEKKGF